MATQTIDATLFASSHPDIVKRTSVSGLIFSVAMLLVGVFIFASIFEMSDKSSTLSMALMVLGTAFVLLGVFRLFWKSKEVRLCGYSYCRDVSQLDAFLSLDWGY